jgi:Recombinase zinc beta ribbon domain
MAAVEERPATPPKIVVVRGLVNGRGWMNDGTRYRYYVCLTAQKRGWHACPSKSVPARTIERFVLERLRGLAAGSADVPADIAAALTARSPQQQARCLRALVARIDYDGAYERVAITLHNNGRPPNAAAVDRLDREKRESAMRRAFSATAQPQAARWSVTSGR